MLLKGLKHVGPSPAAAGQALHPRAQLLEVEAVARQWAHVVGAAFPHLRLQGVGAGDVDFLEHLVPLGSRDVDALVGDQATLVVGVLVGMAHRHVLVVLLDLGEGQAGGELHRPGGGVEGPLEVGDHLLQLLLGGHLVPAAHLDVDGVDLPPAEQGDDVVAELLQLQRLLDRSPVVGGHVDGALVAEEVGEVKHEGVEHVALDPLPAVDEPPQLPQGTFHLHPEDGLHGVHRAHLVGDRADAADAGGDVGGVAEAAAPQEGFVEPGRLEDAELGDLHLPVPDPGLQAALALHASEVIDADGPRLGLTGRRHHWPPGRAGHRR